MPLPFIDVCTLNEIKTAGVAGEIYIFFKTLSGNEAGVVNKYSKSWWERATEADIHRVCIIDKN